MDWYREAERELDRRRAETVRKTEEQKEQLILSYPEYAQTEQAIREAGLSLIKCTLAGKDKTADEARLSMLQEQKKRLLAARGLPEDFGEKAYYCPLCRDEGYITENGRRRRCACFHNIYIEKLTASQTDLDTDCRFSDFCPDVYPEAPDKKKYGITGSPRSYMKQVLALCEDFTGRIPDSAQKNLIFTGKTGLGKTFLCACMTNELIARGVPVFYIKASELFEQITFKQNEELKRQLYDSYA